MIILSLWNFDFQFTRFKLFISFPLISPLLTVFLIFSTFSPLRYLCDSHQEKYDVDLAKALVRPGVYEEIRKQVDELLIMNLKKIQMQIAPKSKRKVKKKKKSKKSKKDKKKRGLPGDKIAELRGLDTDQILSMLVEHQLVVRVRNRKLDTFIGDYNYNCNAHHNADRLQGMSHKHVFAQMYSKSCLICFSSFSILFPLFFLTLLPVLLFSP